MIKNITIDEIKFSNLYKEFKNISIGKFSFNYLYSDFIIDTKNFFPISVKSNETSTDLFSHFSRFKYEMYFHEKYFNFIKEASNQMIKFENAFVVGSSNNYYHLLLDWSPRLFALNNNVLEKIDKIIFSHEYLKENKVIETILKELKIDKEIIFLENGNYLFKNSFLPTNFSLKEKIFFYRNIFQEYIEEQSLQKIYITRNDSKNRKIVNEKELIDFLKKKNFKIVELSNFTFINQIALFSNAKVIISLHGAGLTNIIFSKPNTLVIEIAHDVSNENEDWYRNTQKFNSNKFSREHFVKIAKINKLNHYIYFCVDNKINTTNLSNEFRLKKITNEDLIINIEKFSKFYNNLFSNL